MILEIQVGKIGIDLLCLRVMGVPALYTVLAHSGYFPVEELRTLKLARKALENGGTLPAVMNGANEVAVNAFLNRKIKFMDILIIVEKVMNMHNNSSSVSYEAIKESDTWARNTTEQLINQNI